MKLVSLLFLSLFAFSKYSCSQDSLPRVYEIKSDSDNVIWEELNNVYWQILEDKDGKWTINDVKKAPTTALFHTRSVDGKVKTYWTRYRLKNVMSRPAKIALNSNADYDDFYVQKNDGATAHYRSGNYRDWGKKDGLKFANCIPLIVNEGEELLVYQRTHVKKAGLPPDFSILILHTAKTIEESYVNYIDHSPAFYFSQQLIEVFMVGFLLVTFLYTLSFYGIVKEREYLYFSLILFFLAVNRLHNIVGISIKRYSPADSDLVNLIVYAWFFILTFEILFMRSFLKTSQKSPAWDKVLMGANVLVVLLYGSRLLHDLNIISVDFPSRHLFIGVHGFIHFILLVTLLLFARHSGKSGRLVTIGAFPMLFFYGLVVWFTSEFMGSWKSPAPGLTKFFTENYRSIEAPVVLWFVLFVSATLFIRFNNLRKENAERALENERLAREKEVEKSELIAKQKIQLEKEVTERTAELKQSLEELKTTQSQLIQSEKMASLGELTAGIAHEIQNPLNFVNNFSEVNKELVEELKSELASDSHRNGNQQLAIEIADNIKDNSEKINHHGRRADSIVKGMLQHSRTGSGQKELTEINTMADEYLRLSYHGLRAKDKSFNATLETEFDENTGSISILPQEMGRVLLNLFNNAFYAVAEKKKLQGDSYEPIVDVKTQKTNNGVEITVRDNGSGIPQSIIDKIFQPFFTTKPTGQGTGLGLSLSYDIITKGHAGELKAWSKEGEGSAFTIYLPAPKK